MCFGCCRVSAEILSIIQDTGLHLTVSTGTGISEPFTSPHTYTAFVVSDATDKLAKMCPVYSTILKLIFPFSTHWEVYAQMRWPSGL